MSCRYSNNDPQIVAQHYFDVIKCLNGKVCFVNHFKFIENLQVFLVCILRNDHGTENSIICFIHPSLCTNYTNEFVGERALGMEGQSPIRFAFFINVIGLLQCTTEDIGLVVIFMY